MLDLSSSRQLYSYMGLRYAFSFQDYAPKSQTMCVVSSWKKSRQVEVSKIWTVVEYIVKQFGPECFPKLAVHWHLLKEIL